MIEMQQNSNYKSFIFLALFNHSCCPNTTRCNIGSKCLGNLTNNNL